MKKIKLKKKKFLYLMLTCLIATLLCSTYLGIITFTSSAITPAATFETVPLQNIDKADRILIKELTNDLLDQKQETQGVSIKAYVVGPQWICQSVVNDREPFNGFSIAIAEEGTSTERIYVGVISSLLTGSQLRDLNNWEVVGYMNPDTLPEKNVFYWITLEFVSPININAGETFYIIALSDDQNNDQNWWLWGCSGEFGDVYPSGNVFTYNGVSWSAGFRDMMFRTYTVENGGGNGDAPNVVITSSMWVAVIQAFGILSLLGTIMSGMKYMWF